MKTYLLTLAIAGILIACEKQKNTSTTNAQTPVQSEQIKVVLNTIYNQNDSIDWTYTPSIVLSLNEPSAFSVYTKLKQTIWNFTLYKNSLPVSYIFTALEVNYSGGGNTDSLKQQIFINGKLFQQTNDWGRVSDTVVY